MLRSGSKSGVLLAQSYVAASAPADTNEDTLATITVPANTIGANGSLRITTLWTFSGAGGARTARIRYSGASGTVYLTAATGVARTTLISVTTIGNRGATNSQVGNSLNLQDSGNGLITANVTSAVDTTASTTIVITGQKVSAGDVLTLEGFTVEVIH